MRPLALDLFCGVGGASMGLHRAGFEVVGIDMKPQPRYPFRFIQADSLKPPVDLMRFDLIWASPPCQAFSSMSNRWRVKGHKQTAPDLIPQTRELLEQSGKNYIIENVTGAKKSLRNPIRLHGGMFGLSVDRQRLFECSFWFLRPKEA